MMIRLIVGLGNPGDQYHKTRHNAGVWCLQMLCQEHAVILRKRSLLHAQCASLPLSDKQQVILGVSSTFMNQSGRAVGAISHYYKIDPKEILVIHDELDFAPGVARFKFGGGDGGHKGLKDICSVFKQCDFWRLRIRIGHPGMKVAVPNYVLSTPSSTEYKQIQQSIQRSTRLLNDFCQGATEKAMQALHTD